MRNILIFTLFISVILLSSCWTNNKQETFKQVQQQSLKKIKQQAQKITVVKRRYIDRKTRAS